MAFSSTRTFDLLSIAIRFSGLEIRDCISHIYASGFPKSHNLSMGIDALKWSEAKDELIKQYPGKTEEEIKEIAGFKREVVGKKYRISNIERGDSNIEQQKYESRELDFTSKSENSFVTKGATSEAAQFDGYGTALKPACEKVLVFRKKFKGTVAQNALEHGTGGINIDACRVESGGDDNKTKGQLRRSGVFLFEEGNVGSVQQIDLAVSWDAENRIKTSGLRQRNQRVDPSQIPQDIVQLAPNTSIGPMETRQISGTENITHPLKELLERIEKIREEIDNLYKKMNSNFGELKKGSHKGRSRLKTPGFNLYQSMNPASSVLLSKGKMF